MRIELKIGDPGDAVEIEVANIYVAVGDRVNADERVLEVETDKANMEIVAPAGGVVLEIRVTIGQVVDTETVLAVIEAE